MSESAFAAATIVARNYAAHARVLARSFTQAHAGNRLSVLMIDDTEERDGQDEPYDVLRPSGLGVPAPELRRLAAIYDAKELATALKPWLLRHLLELAEVAVFLDPDIEVFAPLDDVARLAGERGIALTPHSLAPIPDDGRSPTELELQASGIYNLGFVAVGRDARPFLEWWRERLSRDCIVDTRHGLFVDQRWAEWVPAYFPHVIVRDPAMNVAHWNLHERTVEDGPDGYSVDGGPLRFFHFSGFDPQRPHLLSAYGYRHPPRILLSEHPPLARLCADYARQLLEAGYVEQRSQPYGYGTAAGGTRLDHTTRMLYRAALVASERAGGVPPPDPFDPAAADAFDRWLAGESARAPVPPTSRAAAYVDELEWRTVATASGRRLRGLVERAAGTGMLGRARRARALLDAIEALEARTTLALTDLSERIAFLERERPGRDSPHRSGSDARARSDADRSV